MATKRPKDLPSVSAPTAGDRLTLDGASTRSITVEDMRDVTETLTNKTLAAGSNTITGLGTANVATNGLANAAHAQMAAYTLKGNATGSTANQADISPAALTLKGSPVSGDIVLIQDSAASNAFKYTTVGAIGAAGSVASINGVTGAVKIPGISGLRISLVTGTPVHGDVSGATTVYATPAYWAGSYVTLYDGTDLIPTLFGERSQVTTDATKSPAATLANANYDIVAWNDGGTPRVTRSDYWKKASTITMTIATPCVVTWANHGLAPGTPIKFTNSGGALPSVTSTTFANTLFVGDAPATNTFNIVSAATNTTAAAYLQTTGSQSGTHTGTAGDDTGATALGSGGNCEADLTTGLYLNKNAITNGPAALRGTILGSIRTDVNGAVTYNLGSAASGGGAALLTVYNIYNAVDVVAEVSDTTASWTQTSATVGPFHGPLSSDGGVGGGLGNRVSLLTRLQRDGVDVSAAGRMSILAVAVSNATLGFAKNSITAFDRKSLLLQTGTTTGIATTVAPRKLYKPVLGWNYFQLLQAGDGSNANAFVGTAVEQAIFLKTRA